MTVRVGINGFGRIGRQSLRALMERTPDVNVVAVNDLIDAQMSALLFKHDSTYGAYPGRVDHLEDAQVVDGCEIKVFKESDPAALPWGHLGVDIVLESTGKFRDPGKSQAHLGAGARKVIISAPAGADFTVVLGVNEDRYDPERHHIISNASCTTNCLVPAVKVVHDLVTIERGLMNTVHSYTTSQRPLVLQGDSRSSIIDSSMTMVIGGTLIKVLAWYDNEWGFSCRVADLIGLVAAKLPVASRGYGRRRRRHPDRGIHRLLRGHDVRPDCRRELPEASKATRA